jgi:hypothetical protein
VNARSLDRYARAIESRWSEFLERPAVLSPSDWRRITDWHERGIPLELIFDCLDEAAERRRAGRGAKRPRGLSYLAPAVEESWAALVEGRRVENGGPASRASFGPVDVWRRRILDEPSDSPLRALLEGLVEKLGAGVEPQRIERELECELPRAVPGELRRAAEGEAREWLAGHRDRLGEQRFESAVRRASLVRLRRRLRLPRLVEEEDADGSESGVE